MRLTHWTLGLAVALVGGAASTLAADGEPLAIRWLNGAEAGSLQQQTPEFEAAPENNLQPLPPVDKPFAVESAPSDLIPVSHSTPVRQVAVQHSAPAAKPAETSSKPIGGRWMIPVATGNEPTLSTLLTDPFNERRPPDWSPLYRAGRPPRNPVRLMGDAPVAAPATAAQDVSQVSFASQASCGSSACGCSNDCSGCKQGCTSCCTGGCTSGCNSGCNSSCYGGGSGCFSGAYGCGPTWSAGVDALFLWRDAPNAVGPLVTCNCDDNLYFAPSGFDLDTAAAPRFRLFRHSPSGYDFEVSYYNFDAWDNARHFYGDLNVFYTDLGPSAQATAYYESQLQSLELNLLRCHGCWTKLITGFRWVQVDEYASVYGTNGTTTVSRCVDATNNLYGGHFGFRRLLYDYGGCLTLDSTVKAGVFGSDADRDMCIDGVSAPSLSKNGVSFIGDVEFQANFEITCRCTLTAGYQLLWITGLASAAEQFESPAYVNTGETTFYHGANVGMVYTW